MVTRCLPPAGVVTVCHRPAGSAARCQRSGLAHGAAITRGLCHWGRHHDYRHKAVIVLFVSVESGVHGRVYGSYAVPLVLYRLINPLLVNECPFRALSGWTVACRRRSARTDSPPRTSIGRASRRSISDCRESWAWLIPPHPRTPRSRSGTRLRHDSCSETASVLPNGTQVCWPRRGFCGDSWGREKRLGSGSGT